MQEFPEAETLQFLIGLEVTNVILQPFSIDANFDDGSFLVCEHFLDHKNKRGESTLWIYNGDWITLPCTE